MPQPSEAGPLEVFELDPIVQRTPAERARSQNKLVVWMGAAAVAAGRLVFELHDLGRVIDFSHELNSYTHASGRAFTATGALVCAVGVTNLVRIRKT